MHIARIIVDLSRRKWDSVTAAACGAVLQSRKLEAILRALLDTVLLLLECVLFHIRQAINIGVAAKGVHRRRPSHQWEGKSQGSEEVELHSVVAVKSK